MCKLYQHVFKLVHILFIIGTELDNSNTYLHNIDFPSFYKIITKYY